MKRANWVLDYIGVWYVVYADALTGFCSTKTPPAVPQEHPS